MLVGEAAQEVKKDKVLVDGILMPDLQLVWMPDLEQMPDLATSIQSMSCCSGVYSAAVKG